VAAVVAASTTITTTKPAAAVTTTSISPLAGSKAGVQPGVQYDVPGLVDTSAELQQKLAEESLIFLPLAGPKPVDAPFYRLAFTSLPARFSYESFNPLSNSACSGMMSRPLSLVGLWERGAAWDGARVEVSVAEFDNEAAAHELYTAASINLGVDPKLCRRMGAFGIADLSDYSVVHRDLALSGTLPAEATFNSWRGPQTTIGGTTYAQSTRLLVQHGRYVMDIGLVSDAKQGSADDVVVGQIVNELRIRL
jgi:hypothetical protein